MSFPCWVGWVERSRLNPGDAKSRTAAPPSRKASCAGLRIWTGDLKAEPEHNEEI